MKRTSEKIRDELILLRCKGGDRDALNDLIGVYERRLFYFIRRFVDSEEDAWDLLQEVWIRAYRNIRKVHSGDVLAAWLYRIARNVAISLLRKQKRNFALKEEIASLDDPDDKDPSFTSEDAERIHHALDLLPLLQREVITLFFLEEMKLSEVAEIVDAPVGTVKSRLYYAKRALRDILEGLSDE